MILDFLKAYLFSKRAKSHTKKMAWISLSAIIIGSFSLIVVLSIMSGLNQSTEKRLLKSEPHLVVMSEKKSQKIERYFKDPQVSFAYFFEIQDVLIKTEDGIFNGAEAVGISKEALMKKKSFIGFDNTPIVSDLDDFETGEDIFMGATLASELRLVVGDFLELYQPEDILKSNTDLSGLSIKKVRLAGVLNNNTSESEGRQIFYKKSLLFTKDSKSLNTGYEFFFKDPDNSVKFKKIFNDMNVKSQTWKERNSSLFTALKLEKFAMTFLLGMALIITSFSIMTLLILLVVQKQKDIGILLSQGFSQFNIRLLFGGLGVALSTSGVFIGVFFGSLVSIFMDIYPIRILPPIYQDPYLPAHLDGFTVFWVLFFCLVVAFLSSLIPIIYLSDLSPVRALKESLDL